MPNEFDIYKSIPFIQYYQKVNGSSIKIDLEKRVVEIYDNSNIFKSKVNFSSKIIEEFDENDLLKSSDLNRNKVYYVFVNGTNGLDWLWFYGDLINISEIL